MSLRLRLAVEWLLIGGIASLLVIFALNWRGIDDFDNIIYDQIASFGRPDADPDILIVAIDDRSLSEIGKWPWPRNIHAELFEKLKPANPNSVALDVIISEPSADGGDELLTDAIANMPSIFLPLHFITPGSDGRDYDTQLPIEKLRQAATATGHVNLSDRDDVIRRASLCFDPQNGSGKWPHLMELIYRTRTKGKASRAFADSKCGSEFIVPYAKRGSFATISYTDLVSTNVPPDLIRNKDVIIGATATGLGDSHPVPFADGGLMPGAEIMANMLSALKSDGFIRPLGEPITLVMSILPIWLLLFAFLRFSPKRALLSSIAFILVILVSSAVALNYGIWFPPGAALAGIFIIYPLWGWRRLQAVSDFMDRELSNIDASGDMAPLLHKEPRANDIVGRQSAALGSAIDHIRDLRRFVSDVLSDLPDPMAVVDRKGTIILSNNLVEERIGGKVDGMNITEIADIIVTPAHHAAVLDYIDAADANSADTEDENGFIRFNAQEGSTFVMRRSPVISDKERHLGDIYYLTDISALAEAETQREEVLQLLSHDMRAPQSAIIASLEGKLDTAARKRIERNARRTMRLAQDFVDMARMAETEFAGDDILLADLVRDVADNLWPLAEERQVKIHVEDRSNSGFVLAEPDALSRAISNLIDNAIKFSPEGSNIDIAIRRIEIGRQCDLTVTISDNGSGISEEILPRLFSRFSTDDNEKRRAKGAGLGLAYVETVAVRHGGSIRAENRKNGGADFILMLPEASEETAD